MAWPSIKNSQSHSCEFCILGKPTDRLLMNLPCLIVIIACKFISRFRHLKKGKEAITRMRVCGLFLIIQLSNSRVCVDENRIESHEEFI